MKKIVTLLTIILLIAAGAFLIKKKKEEINTLPTAIKAPLVIKVVAAKEMEVKETKDFLGTYYAFDNALIGTKFAGFIKKVFVEEGKEVKKGDILIKIDDINLKAQISAQKSKIDSINYAIKAQKALLDAVKEEVLVAKKSFLRDKKLYKAGAISKERFDMAKATLLAKEAKLLSTKAALNTKIKELSAAKEVLSSLLNSLNYTTIKAPFDAVVEKIFFKEGSFVPLAKPVISLLGEKWVIDIPFYSGIKKDTKILAMQKRFRVDKILPFSKNSLKIARVYAKLPLPNKSEIKVTAIINEAKGKALPITALYEEGGKKYVFIYKNNKFIKKEIKIEVLGDKYFIPKTPIKNMVATGTNQRLAQLNFNPKVEVRGE